MALDEQAVQYIATGILLFLVYLLIQGSFSAFILGILIFLLVLYVTLK